jgi:hypothetical protein
LQQNQQLNPKVRGNRRARLRSGQQARGLPVAFRRRLPFRVASIFCSESNRKGRARAIQQGLGDTVQTTYFASFLLGEQPSTTPPSIDDAVETIAQWIFNNPHRPLSRPRAWPDGGSEPIRFPNGERVQLLRLKNGDDVQTAAVRFEHSDQQSRHWRTDCILTRATGPQTAVRFAVTHRRDNRKASVAGDCVRQLQDRG